MIRLFLHRLLGLGKIAAEDRKSLESEGIEVLFEGISESITYRNYGAPGKFFLARCQWVIGSLAITRHRFVAYAHSRRLFNVPLGNSSLGGNWGQIFILDIWGGTM